MAAGGSGQQNFRKAIATIKDSTLVGIAKVNSEYKDLSVSILKATNHVEVLPKEKHVRTILGALSGSRPRAYVSYCIHSLTRRLAKTHTWVVALKTLIVIHRALREVDHSFCEEMISHKKTRGHLVNLLHFKDDLIPSAWDYSNWIRSYALYIEECLECFRVIKYDFYRDYSRTKKFDTSELLEHLPAMQKLLFHLLACHPVGAARYNFIIQYALSIVAAESVRLYVAITDGVLIVVDKFFEMQRNDALRALDIYRRSSEQARDLSMFFEMCQAIGYGLRQKYVKIEQPPASFLTSMEEYVKEAPQTLMLPWRSKDDDGGDATKVIAIPSGDVKTDPEETINDITYVASLIPDLLSWDEPAPELDKSKFEEEPTGWELALVATTSEATSIPSCKANVLDRSTLESLYDAASTNQTPPIAASSNPFETSEQMIYDPYFMQVALMEQRNQGLMHQQEKSVEIGLEANDCSNPFWNPFNMDQDSVPQGLGLYETSQLSDLGTQSQNLVFQGLIDDVSPREEAPSLGLQDSLTNGAQNQSFGIIPTT